jgi:ribA/ribD-fused uncharacterized protein
MTTKLLPKENYYRVLENDWGVFFWNPPGFLSNFTWVNFKYNDVNYVCGEQAIMHYKALLFGDLKTAEKIMSTKEPNLHKKYGREVVNFNDKIWKEKIPIILYDILICKFTQNKDYLQALLATKDKKLHEASPRDFIWGIGVNPETAVKCTEEESKEWTGKNLLGKTLMKVRKTLEEESI